MNRQQRRAAMKQTPAYRRGVSAEEMIRRMSRNGITVEDYDNARQKEYDRGFSEGVRAGREETIKMAYAAACLAAKEQYGFARSRCLKLLLAIDDQITNHLHSEEAIQDVFDKMGLTIDFNDPLEPVKEIG